MSKVKLLLDVISDVRSLADSLQAVADAMMNSEATTTDATPVQEPVKEEKQPSEKKYSMEDVRGVLADKSQKGLTAEVKALIEKYGGSKLSDISPENYAAIIADAEVLS